MDLGVEGSSADLCTFAVFDDLQGNISLDNLGKKLSKRLNATRLQLVGTLTKRKADVLQRIRTKNEQLLSRFKQNPRFVKLKDKVAFFLGVFNTVTIAFLVGAYPSLLPYWYALFAPVLLFLRFLDYHSSKDHYYLLDFCYFTNTLMSLYLFFYPNFPDLFRIVFTMSNGPLLWAVPTWRNSLVFHSLDKVTSVFIHSVPPLICFALRWYSTEDAGYVVCPPDGCSFHFVKTMSLTVFFYLFWQCVYSIKTDVVDKTILQQDEGIATSQRYLTRDSQSLIARLCYTLGFQNSKLGFYVLQFLYTVVTALPTPLMYSYFWIHLVVMLGCLSASVWNGSNFYIEKFSADYTAKLKQLMDENFRAEVNAQMQREGGSPGDVSPSPQDTPESSPSTLPAHDSPPPSLQLPRSCGGPPPNVLHHLQPPSPS